ncbi:unnamed protein product [Prunus brigantina]
MERKQRKMCLCGTVQEDAAIRGGDKLILRGLKFHGFHGVKPEERTLGQKFVIDVDAWMDLREAGKSDRLSDTISYTEIYRIVKEVVEGPPHNLLESVAQLIASTTLKNYTQISAVSVKVGKPHVAVHGPLDYLGPDTDCSNRSKPELIQQIRIKSDAKSAGLDSWVKIV